GAHAEAGAQRFGRRGRTHGDEHDLGVAALFQAQRLLDRVLVGGVQLARTTAVDGRRIGSQAHGPTRHVLHTDGDLHGLLIVPADLRPAPVPNLRRVWLPFRPVI